MSIMDYAAEQGWEPRRAVTSAEWFSDHPDAASEAREMKEARYSNEQIRLALAAVYGFPFKAEQSVKAAWA